jgi:hypothetical protein
MKLHEAFSPEESKKIYDNFLAIVNDPKRRDRLVRKHGKNAENVAYGTAVNQVKRQAANTIEEPQPEETMEDTRLREMVIDALTEKSKPKARPDYPDIDKDGDREESMKKAAQDKKKMQMEDLDLGHEDDEPHMLKADLYRIGKYAMELYKMVDQFEGEQEVDFPHWWQSKIVQAKSMLVSAKHYLDFETKEPQIDAMVDVASEEGAIGEGKLTDKEEKIVKGLKKSGFKKGDPEMYAIAKSKAKAKIKEAILSKLQESKGEYAKIEKQIADLKSKGKNAGDAEMQKLIKRRAELEKSKK